MTPRLKLNAANLSKIFLEIHSMSTICFCKLPSAKSIDSLLLRMNMR